MKIREAEKLGYKVLTGGLTSLGLMRCSIVQYRVKRWNYPLEPPQAGTGPGGLWVTREASRARSLVKYVAEKYAIEARVHLCIVDAVLWENPRTGRLKTDRLFLLEKIQI